MMSASSAEGMVIFRTQPRRNGRAVHVCESGHDGRVTREHGFPVLRQYSDRPRFTHADVPTADQTKTASVPMTLVPIAIGDAQRSHAVDGCRWTGASGRIDLHRARRESAASIQSSAGPGRRSFACLCGREVILSARQAKTCASDRGTPIEQRALPRRRQPVGQRLSETSLADASTTSSPDTSGDSTWRIEFELAEVIRDKCAPGL